MSTDDPSSVLLAKMSWPEVESAFDEGTDTVILPLGATEQHGPHLPLETDTRLATALAERIARRLGDTLVAPAIPVGPSEAHAEFPGTISISQETLSRLLHDCVASFERQGFDRVVILPGHGGCFPVVNAVYPELARSADPDLVAVTDLRRHMELLEEGLAAAGIEVDVPVAHAGAGETAMVLAIDPALVDETQPEGHTGPVSAAALFSEGLGAYASSGVLGNAREATPEAGKHLLEHVAGAHASYIRDEFRELAARREDHERGDETR